MRKGVGGQDGQVTQSNSASAAADAASTGSAGAGADGSSSGATAATEQSSPGNSNVDVRVGSPGDNGPVYQSNNAQAEAHASSVAGGDGKNPGGVATAGAAQTAPSNVNVSVRVASPGDNGPVTQENAVAASANAPGSTGGDTQSVPEDPASPDQGVETTGEAGVVNSGAVSQSIDQDQGGSQDTAARSSDSTDAAAQAPTTAAGSASAVQSGASNVSVSVRVGSPGSDGVVTQSNTAAAAGSTPDSGAVTVTDGTNVDVSVDLPGPASLPALSPDEPWTWSWVWTGGGDQSEGPPSAPTDGNTWSWVWPDPQAGDPTPGLDASAQPTSAETASGTATTSGPATTQTGVWSWSWTWTLANGDTWSLNLETPCDCSWTWAWSWDWSGGTPASVSAAGSAASRQAPHPSATADVGPVTQSNVAAADAVSLTDAQVAQIADTSQARGRSRAGDQAVSWSQSFFAAQSATATATVTQEAPSNLSFVWGVATRGVTQANVVQAIAWAGAGLDVHQAVVQRQDGGEGFTAQWEGATQLVASIQSASAVAQAAQDWASNVNVVTAPEPNSARIGAVWQTNSSLALADAEITAVVVQWIGQFQTAGVASVQQAVATQELGSEQTAVASASTSQTGIANLNRVVVPAESKATSPAITQLNHAEADSGAYDDLASTQSIRQAQGGASDVELSSATQLQVTTQTARAGASAEQADLLNKSGWRGVGPRAGSSGAAPRPEATASFQVDRARLASTGWVFGDGWKPGGVTVHVTALPPGSRAAGELGTHALGRAPHLVVSAGTTTAILRVPHAQQLRGAQAPGRSSSPSPAFAGAPGSGAAGSAPSPGGGGAVGVISRPFKLAAPAHLGPQSPAPGLGRPVAFLDPFERPG